MRPSAYNILYEDLERQSLVVFNTLHGALAVLDRNERDAGRAFLSPGFNYSGGMAEHLRDQLEAGCFLVKDEVDELGVVLARKVAGVADPNRLDVVVLPTLECNFACAYCYEERRPGRMSRETEEALLSWLSGAIPSTKLVMLHWFGGEPLIAAETVARVTQAARRLAFQCGVELIPHVTTNGSLLSERTMGMLLEAGLYSYQITIDGPKETHDRLRVLRSGGSTFDRVFGNACQLATRHEMVRITLRINFNHSNLHAIPALLATIPEGLRSQFRLALEPIFGACDVSAVDNLPSLEIAAELARGYQRARELGFDVASDLSSLEPGKLVYCYAERENQVLINCNGDVFKCSVGTFRSEDRLGRLMPGGAIEREPRWHQWMALPEFDGACESCVYLPMCMGGCRKMRFEGNGVGSNCGLVASNAAYALKQIALHGLGDVVMTAAAEGAGDPARVSQQDLDGRRD